MSLNFENRICGSIRFESRNQGNFNAITSPTQIGGLYDFTTFTFSSVGIVGRCGPRIQCLRACYSQTVSWSCDTNYFTTASAGIQLWTVPETANYEIEVAGAQGSTPTSTKGGRGVIIKATYPLTQGDKLQLLVGQIAPTGNSARIDKSSPGGGGSFVVKYTGTTNTIDDIYLIAGGGGGTGSDRCSLADALTHTSGSRGKTFSGNSCGGVNGCGGSSPDASSGAGGGFLTNGGQSLNGGGGSSFRCGGYGGCVNATYSQNGGGFGGGGSVVNGLLFRYAGGGGFSGGGASNTFGNIDGSGVTTGHWGGGGGSYIRNEAINVATTNGCYINSTQYSGSAITNLATYNTGSGYIKITKL
jgi:hypothetical protein